MEDTMTTRERSLFRCLPLLLMAANGYAGQLVITNLAARSNMVTLGWSPTTNGCIVAQSSNLRTDQFQYVGAVLSTNRTSLTNSLPSGFFRIRQVAVVDLPDPNLRWLVTNSIVTWYPPRSQVYDIDLAGITNLAAAAASITNATGIGWLVDLVSLDLTWNQLRALDVSGCAILRTLFCANNSLTNLNVSGCTSLQYLSCYLNGLSALDVSGCTSLRELYCYYNQLAALNVSGCSNLQYLYCAWNVLTNASISNCPNLRELDYSNNALTNLNISGATNLQILSCSYNQVTNLSVSGCPRLHTLSCVYNQLTKLSVSGCPSLSALDCEYNLLTDLSCFVSNATAGELVGTAIYLSGNPLSQFAQTNQIPYLESKGIYIQWP